MQKFLPVLFSLFFLCSHALFGQKWGYVTLVAKQNTNSVQLLDTNNMVVKQWSNLTGNNGYSAYLTKGGDLWRTVVATGGSFMGGGICGRIQKVAWNGTLLFDYTVSDANQISHHDICPLPNGNVLLIVYVRKTAAETQAAGATVNQERWSEKVIELKPTGLNTATIVWQWHLWDHLVQNLYPTKNNYQTSILDHPELLNVNYNNPANRKDWVHMNGIDYNAELDQIVVSSHFLNELWVIDHSTTTAEAASHSGGNSGKGGDFLYRWGNPAAYGATGTTNFNVVHDAHWVPADCPRAGWLGGFNNNGVSSSISAVDLFQPPWDGTQYTHTPGQAYLPATYGYRHQANGYSSNMSCSQQLPNGNMLICLATAGKIYEINANGTQIWQYSSPSSFIPQASRYSRCYLENPVATVQTPDPAICSGGTVPLSVSAAATNVNSFTYAWSPSDGLSASNISNPVVSGITDTTLYTVTITTPGGCTATAALTVAVHPAPAAYAGPDQIIQAGQSAALSASGGSSYLWSNGATDESIQVTPASTQTYTVTVTDVNGCTDADEVTVTVITPITATLNAAATAFCAGGGTTLTAQTQGGAGNLTYAWSSTPAGFSANTAAVQVAPTETTRYFVSVSDGFSTATDSIDITVFPLPIADAGMDQSILQGAMASLQAGGGDFYLWSTGETTAGISVMPAQTSIYTVAVTDMNGCSSVDEVTVVVITTLPLEGIIAATDSAICVGEVLQLFATATNGAGTYTYNWTSSPAGFASSLPDPYVNPEETTQYTVVISDGQEQITLTLEVLVHPLEPQPVITAAGDSLVSSSPANNQWFYYGSPIDQATGQVFYPDLDGSYQVQVTGANGCPSPLSEPFEYIAIIPLSGLITASDSAICIGEVLQLQVEGLNGSGNYSYSWTSVPAGFSSQLSNPFVNPEETTLYTVEIADGLTTVVLSLEIVVYPLEPQPVITASGNVLISSSPSNNQWFYYGNPIDGATGQEFAPDLDGSYQVQVIGANGCPSALSEPFEYFVPLPLTGIISATDSVICIGDVIQLTAIGMNGLGNYTYFWTSLPAGFMSNLPDPFVNPEENTLYTVVISDGLNHVTLEMLITVHPLALQPVITVSSDSLISSSPVNNQWFYYGNPVDGADGQVFVPTLEGSYQVQVIDANGCPSALSEPYEFVLSGTHPLIADAQWWMVPNPASDFLHIGGAATMETFQLEILDAHGRLLLQQNQPDQVEISHLPTGVYLVRLQTGSGFGLKKLVIAH